MSTSACARASVATSGGKPSSNAREADPNRSISCWCVTQPTSATSVSARTSRRSSGKRNGVVPFDTILFHVEEVRPPAGEQRLEAGASRGADREHAERVGGFDWRRLVFAKEIHLREDNAVRF